VVVGVVVVVIIIEVVLELLAIDYFSNGCSNDRLVVLIVDYS
jgi:hypothetical protein